MHSVFSKDLVTTIITGNILDGLSDDDDAIKIEMLDDQIFEAIGADGSVVTSIISTNRARVTFKLMRHSNGNAMFSTWQEEMKRTRRLPTITMQIRDNTNRDLYRTQHMSIIKHPEITFGTKASIKIWTFSVPHMRYFTGAAI